MYTKGTKIIKNLLMELLILHNCWSLLWLFHLLGAVFWIFNSWKGQKSCWELKNKMLACNQIKTDGMDAILNGLGKNMRIYVELWSLGYRFTFAPVKPSCSSFEVDMFPKIADLKPRSFFITLWHTSILKCRTYRNLDFFVNNKD